MVLNSLCILCGKKITTKAKEGFHKGYTKGKNF